MNRDMELRRHWRVSWLSSIRAFADDETQQRLWLDMSNRNPRFSFAECLCSYFDDTGLADEGYEGLLREGLVSTREVAAVAHFHRLAASYESPTDDDDHAAILSDARWAEVVAAARQAQAALLALIDDPQERRGLEGK
ncbi:hypothetical protein [Ancylobacter polymorphus]|uniref:Uncharacterized protein n=1 Tax=Ancylobacter polymorphus TaxID=223390 RepID=A0A9E7A0I8_9HYPH|nr:hypothetical protein [Ancylobacter polymorphus]UOK70810.1 hypothetical protein K9D25_19195 [Ancylobacter polymorphus]